MTTKRMIFKIFSGRSVFRPLLIVSLLCALCSKACTQINLNPTPTPPNDVVKLLYWQAPTILNRHLATGFKDFDAARIVYEPLASYDKDGNLILFLAAEVPTVENGGIAKDGKSVTWKLKQNVRWSDGQPFTAEDVVFTYKYITNPEVRATTTEFYATVETVEAVDDYTVKIKFKDVTAGWDVPFTGQNGPILPRHIFEGYNGPNAHDAPVNNAPVGTGPYRVVEFREGDIIVYEANPYYWDEGKPFIKRVELRGGGDATSAASAVLQTGEADYAYNVQVEANVLQDLEEAGKGEVMASFGPYVERIMFNFTDPNKETADGERSSLQFPHPFFTDKRVRQAFNLAIDRDGIANLYGLTGRATAQLLVSPSNFKSKKITYEFNLKKAAALLDEAGWVDTNGNGIRDKNNVEMKVLFQTSASNPVRQKTQEIVKKALEDLGVEVELKTVESKIFFSSEPDNTDTINHFYADLQMFFTGNKIPDPGPHMKWWTCDDSSQKKNRWQKNNFARYCNSEYDRIWQKSTTERDPEKRAELFRQMNEILSEDIAVMPIVHRTTANAVSDRLNGVEPSPWDANTWDIKNWKIE